MGDEIDPEDFFCGDLSEEYEKVTTIFIEEQSRSSTYYSQVFKKKSDGTFWQAFWGRGSTEYQDNGIEDFDLFQVVPMEKTITVYERVTK